jgi:hypothetical protein
VPGRDAGFAPVSLGANIYWLHLLPAGDYWLEAERGQAVYRLE